MSFVCLKKYKKNCKNAQGEKSAVSKHAWTYDHYMKQDKATIFVVENHGIKN